MRPIKQTLYELKNLVIALCLLSSISVNTQNGYYDLESITKSINTDSRYIVTGKTLKVRVSGQYHKAKAGVPFYTLKKGDIVKVESARKGVFANKEGKWFEIFLYDEKGFLVPIPSKEIWKPNKVWGIVDASELEELKESFFIINENCSIQLTGRTPYRLYVGDTIVAENVDNAAVIPVKPIKNGYRINNLFGNRKDGGSKFEGILNNKYLTPIKNDSKYDPANYKTRRYFSQLELQSHIRKYNKEFFYLLFILIFIVFLIVSRNRPNYNFSDRRFRINKKDYLITVTFGEVRKSTEYYNTEVWVPDRIERVGNTETHYQGYYEKRTNSVTCVYFNSNPIARRYRTFRLENGMKAIQYSVNGQNIAFYYFNINSLKSSFRDFWITVFKSVNLKFKVTPIFILSILSFFTTILYLNPELYFNIGPIERVKTTAELFNYSLPEFNFDWYGPFYRIKILKFIALILGAYLFILFLKHTLAIKRMQIKLKKHLVNIAVK